MINTNDIHWLAGWLEGEGSFTIYRDGSYNQFRVEFSSTDFDIMERVKSLLRTDQKIYTRKQRYSQIGNKNKPEYYLKVYGSLAIQWMMTLYSIMGRRRKEKIKEILIAWRSYVQNGSGKCRRCGSTLIRTIIKSGWNKGKGQTYCRLCRMSKHA